MDLPDWMRRALDGDDSDIPIQTYAEHRAELLAFRRQSRIEERMRGSNLSYEEAERDIRLEERADEIYDANKDWSDDGFGLASAIARNPKGTDRQRPRIIIGVSVGDVERQIRSLGLIIDGWIDEFTLEGLREYAEEVLWDWSYERAETEIDNDMDRT